MIVIVDYGMGNVGSIQNMVKKIGSEVCITSDHSLIEKADKLIIPGVGSFDNGMKELNDRGLTKLLTKKVLKDMTPVLGICLGMQLMTEKSEEGNLAGLGWIKAETKRFTFETMERNLKVPHMGWNYVTKEKESKLFNQMYIQPRFYFVHSYYVICNEEEDILTSTEYGHKFTSAFQHKNMIGMQFHPEKSHKYGLKIIENFVEGF